MYKLYVVLGSLFASANFAVGITLLSMGSWFGLACLFTGGLCTWVAVDAYKNLDS